MAWRGLPRPGDANRTTGGCLGLSVLSSMVVVVLRMIGRIKQNPGSAVEVKNIVKLLWTGCGRNLKLGIQFEVYGRCYHYSCASVKGKATEREKCNCDKRRTDKVRMPQEDLQKALRQIDELKSRNREPEETLLPAGAGKRDTTPAKQKFANCMVVGDSMLRNVGAEHTDMTVKCYQGIKTEHLH